MRLPRVVVVVPAYNEECLDQFLAEVERSLLSACARLSFLVVDDCSPVQLPVPPGSQRLPLGSALVVVRNETNLGHGPTALRAWTLGVSGDVDVVLHVDGDGQFLGEDFPRVLDALHGRDGVVGTRLGRRESWYRRVLSLGARLVVGEGLLGADVNTPLRAYHAPVVRRLLASVPEESVVPHLHFARLHAGLELDVIELGVAHRPRRGESMVGTSWRAGRGPAVIPSRRLINLAWRALWELRASRTESRDVPSTVSLANDAA